MLGLFFSPTFRTMLIYQLVKVKVSKPQSDVPVTFGIRSQPWQSTLSVDSCKVEIIHSPLGLFEYKALVRFILKGNLLSTYSNWQPYIEEVNISERLVRNDGYELIGDIMIVPIVGQKPIQKNMLIFIQTNRKSHLLLK